MVPAMPHPSPRDIVNRQLEVYNARDIDGYCALFAPEATISDLVTGEMICNGIDEIRSVYSRRFADHPALHCIVRQKLEGPTPKTPDMGFYNLWGKSIVST